MLTAYGLSRNCPRRLDHESLILAEDTVWVDLLNPTREEDAATEHFLGIDVPTREEAQEIEFSSRFYEEDGAVFMTATLVSRTDDGEPMLSPVTFILKTGRVGTVRYHDFTAFRQFLARSAKGEGSVPDATGIFLGLLEAVIDRLADIIERIGADVDGVNSKVFTHRGGGRTARYLELVIGDIGMQGDFVGKARESLASLQRLIQYVAALTPSALGTTSKANRGRVKLMERDLRSLAAQVDFLAGKITFLLDATLGLITVQQNEVVRILTVVATFFFPPTLIGTIYGMNFKDMPELSWPFGYPLALLLMVLSALLPYLFFKRRGWL